MTRRIAAVAGAAAVVLLLAWFMLLWSPKGGELTDARERNATAEQKVNELQVRLDRLKDAQQKEPELLATRDRLKSAVPDDAQVAQFIFDANDAAAAAGVDFISISPERPAQSDIAGAPPDVGIRLDVSGDYFATLDFLDRLADLPRLVVLDQVQLAPSEDGGKLSAKLGGSIFTTEEPAAAAGRPSTTASTTATSTTTTTVKP